MKYNISKSMAGKLAVVITLIGCIFFSFVSGFAQSTYRLYRSDTAGFELIIPLGWKMDEVQASNKSIFSAFCENAEIVVYKSLLSDSEIPKHLLHKRGNDFHSIIHDETLRVNEVVRGKISVYYFRKGSVKYLQRRLQVREGDYIYNVYCTSSAKKFYEYEEAFNIAIKSFTLMPSGGFPTQTQKTSLLSSAIRNELENTDHEWFKEDFSNQAHKSGFTVPEVKDTKTSLAIGFESNGKAIFSEATTSGVVTSYVYIPKFLGDENYSMYLWKNGEETLVADSVKGGATIQSKVVLVRGDNYICSLIKKDDQYLVRSPVALIRSSISDSLARFEMTWNGPGDMDLHLASVDGSWHVNFVNRSIYFGGNNAYLDVDNIFGYGPENIRILSIPQKTKVRCFVNYYSGHMPLLVTVKYYDRTNKLVRKYEKKFSVNDIMPTSHFNNKSWLVGEFFIEP